MSSSHAARFRLTHAGRLYEVASRTAGLQTVAQLFVDDQLIEEKKGMDRSLQLTGGDLIVVVYLGFMGDITEVLAVPNGTNPGKVKEEGIAFTAPAGSRAARLEQMRREHPVLYAARHVALAVLQVGFGVLGIGALLGALLPRVDLPDIPIPRIDLPAIPWPAFDLPELPWPDIPLPAIDVPLPDLALLAPLQDLWGAVNWLVPIVIAIIVAWNEYDKRRKRQNAAQRRG